MEPVPETETIEIPFRPGGVPGDDRVVRVDVKGLGCRFKEPDPAEDGGIDDINGPDDKPVDDAEMPRDDGRGTGWFNGGTIQVPEHHNPVHDPIFPINHIPVEIHLQDIPAFVVWAFNKPPRADRIHHRCHIDILREIDLLDIDRVSRFHRDENIFAFRDIFHVEKPVIVSGRQVFRCVAGGNDLSRWCRRISGFCPTIDHL